MKNLTIIFLTLVLVLVGAIFANNALAKESESKKIDGNICTKEYAPVCGIDNITYGNECMAQTTQIAYEGECLVADPQVRCTMDYNPVCGIDGNTYSNTCVAEQGSGIKVAYEGECGAVNPTSGTFLADSEIPDLSNEELASA